MSEICQDTGWTVEHCLTMPAQRFFLLSRDLRRLRYEHLRDLARIAAIPAYQPEYLKDLLQHYNERITGLKPMFERPQPTAAPTADEDPQKAQALLGLFWGMHGV